MQPVNFSTLVKPVVRRSHMIVGSLLTLTIIVFLFLLSMLTPALGLRPAAHSARGANITPDIAVNQPVVGVAYTSNAHHPYHFSYYPDSCWYNWYNCFGGSSASSSSSSASSGGFGGGSSASSSSSSASSGGFGGGSSASSSSSSASSGGFGGGSSASSSSSSASSGGW